MMDNSLDELLEKQSKKLTDRELSERTFIELNKVNQNLAEIHKRIWWIVPILALIAVVLISVFPPLWLR